MRTPKLHEERGIALAIAVFALVVIGALVAGTFFAGRVEQQSGENSLHVAQAFEAAEAGLGAAAGSGVDGYLGLSGFGDSLMPVTASLGTNTSYTWLAKQLGGNIVFVRSEGSVTDGAGRLVARRQLGEIRRLTFPQMDLRAAVTIRGRLTLGGSSEISGADYMRPADTLWANACPGFGTDTLSGIRGSGMDIQTNGAGCSIDPATGAPRCVTGDPAVEIDSTVTDSTFTNFGDMSFNELAAQRDIYITGGSVINGVRPDTLAVPTGSPTGTRGRCRLSNQINWGEPWGNTPYSAECGDYFPIIFADGNMKLNGGRGQGILLVKGDLELTGGVEFYGPVIVQGSVKSAGTGGHIYGGLMARNADLEANTFTGNSVVNYSACAVRRALRGAGSLQPLASRSWVQMY